MSISSTAPVIDGVRLWAAAITRDNRFTTTRSTRPIPCASIAAQSVGANRARLDAAVQRGCSVFITRPSNHLAGSRSRENAHTERTASVGTWPCHPVETARSRARRGHRPTATTPACRTHLSGLLHNGQAFSIITRTPGRAWRRKGNAAQTRAFFFCSRRHLDRWFNDAHGGGVAASRKDDDSEQLAR